MNASVCRIIDNMPITWCYDVENGQKYCSTGFPIGCLVDKDGKQKDACVISVSKSKTNIHTQKKYYM